MITPPLSISARPVLRRKVARSGMDPYYEHAPTARLPRGLLEFVGADAVFVRGFVAGVEAVRESLHQRHQRRVGPREAGAVRGEVEGHLGVLPHLRHRRVGDRQGAGAAVQRQLHRPQQQWVGAAGGKGDDQGALVDPAEPLQALAAGRGDDFGTNVQQAERVAQVAGEEGHLVDADDHDPLRLGERGDRVVDLFGGQLARGFLEVRVVGAERALELGVVEAEERAAVRRAGGGDRRPVLLDRGLLQLRVTLEAERLREADDGRGGGAGAAGELLGGEEGRLVEVVDDVAGDVFLGARELFETLLDVVGKAFELWGLRRGLGHGGQIRPAWEFPFWETRGDDARRPRPARQPQHDRLRPAARERGARRPRGDPAGARPRRAFARRQAPLPPLRTGLAHLRRRPRGGRAARRRRRLAVAGLAARYR